MVAYAYLRVSTDHQDLDNQRHGILEYANTHAISHLKFIKDKTSGTPLVTSNLLKIKLRVV